MSELEDNRLVDYLYGEMDPSERRAFQEEMQADQGLADTVGDMQSMLGSLRTLDTEEHPSDHLDSLILAQARQATEPELSWIQKLLRRPSWSLAFSGAVALAIAVVVLPNLQTQHAVNDFSGVETNPRTPPVTKKIAAKPPSTHAAKAPVEIAENESSQNVGEKEPKEFQANEGKTTETRVAKTLVRRGAQKRPSGLLGGSSKLRKAKRNDDRASAEVAKKEVARKLGTAVAQLDSEEEAADLPTGIMDSDRSSNAFGSIGSKGSGASVPPPPAASPVAKPSKLENTAIPAPAPQAALRKMAESVAAAPARQRRASVSRTKKSLSTAPADRAESIPQDRQQKEAWAREQARNAQKIARNFLRNGDVESARRTYLRTRARVVRTVAFFEVSLWLAQLEYSQGRFADARRFAAEAGRSRDQSIQEKAREVVARVREDQGQLDSVPASTD